MKTYIQPQITSFSYQLQSPLLTFSPNDQNGGTISIGKDVVDGGFAKGNYLWSTPLGEQL